MNIFFLELLIFPGPNISITVCLIWLSKVPNEASRWARFNGAHNFGVTIPSGGEHGHRFFYLDNNISITVSPIWLCKVSKELYLWASFNADHNFWVRPSKTPQKCQKMFFFQTFFYFDTKPYFGYFYFL